MKRWHTIALAGVLVLIIGYVVVHRQHLGLNGHSAPASTPAASDTADALSAAATPEDNGRPANIIWQKVDRPKDGFRVEMPTNVSQIQVPAYNEQGGTDEVNMIFSNPDAATTFSVAWEDNPPVARVNKDAADRTLEMARDGATTLTQTTLVGETKENTQGFPGRDFSARNKDGGVMNSRLIYAGNRLYMLTAAFPSPGARRDKDVLRFFNSFVVTNSGSATTGNSGS